MRAPSPRRGEVKQALPPAACARRTIATIRPCSIVPQTSHPVLYVVGGLYGNAEALDAVEQLASAERARVTLVFNGDFHWFDAEPLWFAALDRRVARHAAIRGNVETEIARPAEVGAGCGCAYPESVDDGVVQRSNLILAELRTIATTDVQERLATLPMHLRRAGRRIAHRHRAR